MLNVVVKKEEGQHQEALKFFEKSPQGIAQEQQQQQQQQQRVSPTAVTEFPRLLFVLPLDCASQVLSVEKLRRHVVQLIGGIRS